MAKAISVESMTVTGSVPAELYGSADTKAGRVRAWVSTVGAGPDVLLVTLSWTITFGTARIASSTCASARLSSTGGHGTRNAAVPPAHVRDDAVTVSEFVPRAHCTGATKQDGPHRRNATGRAPSRAPTPASSSRSARAARPGPGASAGPGRSGLVSRTRHLAASAHPTTATTSAVLP